MTVEIQAIALGKRAGMFVELCGHLGAHIGTVDSLLLGACCKEKLPPDLRWILLALDSAPDAMLFVMKLAATLQTPENLASIFKQFGRPKLMELPASDCCEGCAVIFPGLRGKAVPI